MYSLDEVLDDDKFIQNVGKLKRIITIILLIAIVVIVAMYIRNLVHTKQQRVDAQWSSELWEAILISDPSKQIAALDKMVAHATTNSMYDSYVEELLSIKLAANHIAEKNYSKAIDILNTTLARGNNNRSLTDMIVELMLCNIALIKPELVIPYNQKIHKNNYVVFFTDKAIESYFEHLRTKGAPISYFGDILYSLWLSDHGNTQEAIKILEACITQRANNSASIHYANFVLRNMRSKLFKQDILQN